MRIVWITDPHLNHCSLHSWERLVAQIDCSDAAAILITGDISEGEDVVFQLLRLADVVARPIHFVLGNHDFYHSSVARTRVAVWAAAAKHPLLTYLRDETVVELTPHVALVGEDGWGDATQGDYERSVVRLNDFRLIDDFQTISDKLWRGELEKLGLDAADRLRSKLEVACQRYPRVIVATHVPPFRESCWYEGHTTDDHWAPFFVCGQVGKVLAEVAQQNPQTRFEVYCGHTHHGGIAEIAANLKVITGGATYGYPDVTGVIEV
jgi:Icc protein